MSVDLQIEYWPAEKLIPYARNPRKNDAAVERMASLIREFGFRVPVIAKSDGSVIDGHLRLKAAKKLGMDTVPVVLADDLTPAQVKALRLSINKSYEFAEWDFELLKFEFDELKDLDFDLGFTGFDNDEILKVLDVPPNVEFKEYDESVANEVEWNECPSCGHKWPK